MNAEYQEWTADTKIVPRIVDIDEFWVNWCNDGALQADSYWHRCYESGESYCYGRNNPYVNLAQAENQPQTYNQTIIPPEVWDVPNNAFQKLMRFNTTLQ